MNTRFRRGVNADSSPKASDVLIAVMGITGSGKSSLISKLIGRDIGIGHNLQSCTSQIGIYSFEYQSRRVYLVDTPGFDDTNRTDTEVLKDVALYLSNAYEQKLTLAGIIYLHRITDVRMAGSAFKNLKMFRALCGEDHNNVFKHVVLATTMWGKLTGGLDNADGRKRRAQLLETKDWWGMMHQRGSLVYDYEDSIESAKHIVAHIVGLNTKVVLGIQKEMVDDKKSLENTSAGQEVEKELQEVKLAHQKELADLEVEAEQALAEKDEEYHQELLKHQKETSQKLKASAKAQEDLKMNFQRLKSEQEEKLKKVTEDGKRNLKALEIEFRKKEEARAKAVEDRLAKQEEAYRKEKSAQEKMFREFQQEHEQETRRKQLQMEQDRAEERRAYERRLAKEKENSERRFAKEKEESERNNAETRRQMQKSQRRLERKYEQLQVARREEREKSITSSRRRGRASTNDSDGDNHSDASNPNESTSEDPSGIRSVTSSMSFATLGMGVATANPVLVAAGVLGIVSSKT